MWVKSISREARLAQFGYRRGACIVLGEKEGECVRFASFLLSGWERVVQF